MCGGGFVTRYVHVHFWESETRAITIYSFADRSLLKLRAIPTVGGPSAPLFSFLGAVRFWKRAQDVVQQGYDRVRAGFTPPAAWHVARIVQSSLG